MIHFKKVFDSHIAPMVVIVLFVSNCTLYAISLYSKSDETSLYSMAPIIRQPMVERVDTDLVDQDISKELQPIETQPIPRDVPLEESDFSESMASPFRRTGQDILTLLSALDIRPGERILEIGSNTMRLGILAAVLGAHVIIVENQEIVENNYIKELVDKWMPEIEAVGGHIELVAGDILDTLKQARFQGSAFDHIFAIDVLQDMDEITNDKSVEDIVGLLLTFKSPNTGSIYINLPEEDEKNVVAVPQMDARLRELRIRPVTVSNVPILRSAPPGRQEFAKLYQFDDRVFKRRQIARQRPVGQVRSGDTGGQESSGSELSDKAPETLILFNGTAFLGSDRTMDQNGLEAIRYEIDGISAGEVPVIIVDNVAQEEEIKQNAAEIPKNIVYIRWDDEAMTDEIKYELITLLAVYEGTPLNEQILSKEPFCNARKYLYRK